MKTTALRLHGRDDIRLDTFELPEPREDEILARIVCDSLCMSTYKAVRQGEAHKRVPENVSEKPIILGHECCGEVISVGERWKNDWKPGDRFALQPALGIPDYPWAPGYSFETIGGSATYVVVPSLVIERGCLLPYNADAWFYGSLSEPMSCVISAFREFYHTTPGVHVHEMGLKEGGSLLILAGAGPMGLGAADYALHGGRAPGKLIVTDIDEAKLTRARALIRPNGITETHYINTAGEDAAKLLRGLNGGKGYDDILVMAPVRSLVELADSLLANDGCLNFFAGPTDPAFTSSINFYNVHYATTHLAGTFGGGVDDIREAIELSRSGAINPAAMVTHIGGLDAAAEAVLNLPNLPGGKKLIYTHVSLPLIALTELREKGKSDPLLESLADAVEKHGGLWSAEAEALLLDSAATGGPRE